jgi:hypothetical protein
MPQPLTPPSRARAVVHAVLPDDPMRDAIVGDLHEEFVREAECVGPDEARARYRRRAAGVVAHAAVDVLRGRRWASATPPAEPSPAPGRTPAGRARRAGRAELGVGALALGVLLVGIVVNTMLFAGFRQAPPAGGAAMSAAVRVAAAALGLGCAAVAAVVLCAGPRWLRRRLHRRARPLA